MSAISLLLCITMLVGTTFAWFTDIVGSNENKIKAGKLDVELHLFVDGEYQNISDSDNPIFGTAGLASDSLNTLWEPGKNTGGVSCYQKQRKSVA